MQIISKSVQELGVEKKLIRSPLEFFRIKRKNRGDGLGGCAMPCQNGRSMIEMLGVLAIIGVLSVGGIMGYSKAMYRYRLNKTIHQVVTAATNAQILYRGKSYDDGALTDWQIVKKLRLFPEGTIDENGDGINGFGYSTLNFNLTNNKYFSIFLGDIPEEACYDILSYDWRSAGAIAIEFDDKTDILLPPEYYTMANIDKICSTTFGDGFIYNISIYFGSRQYLLSENGEPDKISESIAKLEAM